MENKGDDPMIDAEDVIDNINIVLSVLCGSTFILIAFLLVREFVRINFY